MSTDAFLSRDLDGVARALGRIAAEAGCLLAAVADRGAGRQTKADGSPTTAADLAAERLIVERLGSAWPAIPVVAEESVGSRAPGDIFFLVDPLDGTRDYLTGAGEYSVNIALVSGTRPIAAAIAAPADGRVWMAGTSATVSPMDRDAPEPARVRPSPPEGLVALVSRRHGDTATEAVLSRFPVGRRRTASSAYKFCLVASGEADLYVRCGPTMEWDIAAGDHILTCAGGAVVGADGGRMTYGHVERGYLNGPFAALGGAELARDLRLTG